MTEIQDSTNAPPVAADAPGDNRPIYSVGEISQALKRTVEGAFSDVRVRGEVTRITRAASGHMYLTLKDDNAVLDGVCWKGNAARLGFQPEEGMEVIATGKLSTYSGRSSYQIVIDSLELAGAGALLKLLEDRRKKLAAEGLFDEARKRELPYLPEIIGVVTSPTGAVIADILHRLGDRFPRHVLLWPVLVQGESAAAEIAAAIDGFNRLESGGAVPRPDLLIIARGGGSLEDLWAFNEEITVRAAAASDIPLISAIGHETDTTLIDFAADRRAPTPSAAAEMAVPVRRDLMAQVSDDATRLLRAMMRGLESRTAILEGLARGLPKPARIADEAAQRLDDRAERLANAMRVVLERCQADIAPAARALRRRALDGLIDAGGARLGGLADGLGRAVARIIGDCAAQAGRAGELLRGVSYERVLERGFVLVTGDGGAPVTSVAEAMPGAAIGLRFHDGEARATVDGRGPAGAKISPPGAAARPRAKSRRQAADDGQGRLL